MKTFVDKLVIPVGKGFFIEELDNILFFKTKGNYCEAVLYNEKKHILQKSLGYVENLLPSHLFVRIHQSVVVNIFKIHKAFVDNNSEIVMIDGTKLIVSRRKKHEFIQKLKHQFKMVS